MGVDIDLSYDITFGNNITPCMKINKSLLSYDVTSGSEIMPCNKIDKPLVVYRFTGNVMTSNDNNVANITCNDKIITFFTPEMRFQNICHMINRI